MKGTFMPLLVITLAAVFFYSCSKSSAGNENANTIQLDSSAALGKYLTGNNGLALYYFANDANGTSACSGPCVNNWTVFYADKAAAVIGSGLNAADFNTVITASGLPQTTYKGWPLYYYTPAGIPEARGETKGDNVGNVWFVARPSYSVTLANFQLRTSTGINYLLNYTPGNGNSSYLCDDKGNTLYFFARDSAFKNKFTRPDFSNNANFPMYETDNITVPSSLDKTLFSVIIFNGRKQLTYKGWPLYYFGADGYVRGSTKGINFPASQPVGAIWPVATKDVVPAPR